MRKHAITRAPIRSRSLAATNLGKFTSEEILLRITGSGTGNGTVSYTVSANTSTSPRTGTLTAGGQTITITQDAGSWAWSAFESADHLKD